MPIDPDDDISNALNIARQSTGADDIQSKIGGLNQFLSGLDVEANTPQFHTGMTPPQVGGAGMPSNFIPHGDPQRDENLAAFQAGNHPDVPHVVYHGTTASDFNSFKPNIRKNEQLGFGIHHAEDPLFANEYAENPLTARKGDFPRVYASHISVKNPLLADTIVKKGTPEFDLAKKIAGSKLFTQNDENGIPSVYMQTAIDSANPQKAEKLIREAGYDGVRYNAKLISPQAGAKYYSSGKSSPSWIVFDPNQIKSATGNNGQFDPTSPRINEARGGTVEDHAINLVRRHLDHEDYHAA